MVDRASPSHIYSRLDSVERGARFRVGGRCESERGEVASTPDSIGSSRVAVTVTVTVTVRVTGDSLTATESYVADGPNSNSRTVGIRASKARPRWLIAFFSSGCSSAAETL